MFFRICYYFLLRLAIFFSLILIIGCSGQNQWKVKIKVKDQFNRILPLSEVKIANKSYGYTDENGLFIKLIKLSTGQRYKLEITLEDQKKYYTPYILTFIPENKRLKKPIKNQSSSSWINKLIQYLSINNNPSQNQLNFDVVLYGVDHNFFHQQPTSLHSSIEEKHQEPNNTTINSTNITKNLMEKITKDNTNNTKNSIDHFSSSLALAFFSSQPQNPFTFLNNPNKLSKIGVYPLDKSDRTGTGNNIDKKNYKNINKNKKQASDIAKPSNDRKNHLATKDYSLNNNFTKKQTKTTLTTKKPSQSVLTKKVLTDTKKNQQVPPTKNPYSQNLLSSSKPSNYFIKVISRASYNKPSINIPSASVYLIIDHKTKLICTTDLQGGCEKKDLSNYLTNNSPIDLIVKKKGFITAKRSLHYSNNTQKIIFTLNPGKSFDILTYELLSDKIKTLNNVRIYFEGQFFGKTDHNGFWSMDFAKIINYFSNKMSKTDVLKINNKFNLSLYPFADNPEKVRSLQIDFDSYEDSTLVQVFTKHFITNWKVVVLPTLFESLHQPFNRDFHHLIDRTIKNQLFRKKYFTRIGFDYLNNLLSDKGLYHLASSSWKDHHLLKNQVDAMISSHQYPDPDIKDQGKIELRLYLKDRSLHNSVAFFYRLNNRQSLLQVEDDLRSSIEKLVATIPYSINISSHNLLNLSSTLQKSHDFSDNIKLNYLNVNSSITRFHRKNNHSLELITEKIKPPSVNNINSSSFSDMINMLITNIKSYFQPAKIHRDDYYQITFNSHTGLNQLNDTQPKFMLALIDSVSNSKTISKKTTIKNRSKNFGIKDVTIFLTKKNNQGLITQSIFFQSTDKFGKAYLSRDILTNNIDDFIEIKASGYGNKLIPIKSFFSSSLSSSTSFHKLLWKKNYFFLTIDINHPSLLSSIFINYKSLSNSSNKSLLSNTYILSYNNSYLNELSLAFTTNQKGYKNVQINKPFQGVFLDYSGKRKINIEYDYLAKALPMIDQNQINQAKNLLKHVSNTHNDYLEAQLLIAKIYYQSQNLNQALDHWLKVIDHLNSNINSTNFHQPLTTDLKLKLTIAGYRLFGLGESNDQNKQFVLSKKRYQNALFIWSQVTGSSLYQISNDRILSYHQILAQHRIALIENNQTLLIAAQKKWVSYLDRFSVVSDNSMAIDLVEKARLYANQALQSINQTKTQY